MKKIAFILLAFFAANDASAATYRSVVKNTLFVPVDGPGYCNGIKIYNGKTHLFNLGHPGCPDRLVVPGTETDLHNDSYVEVVELAQQLQTYIKKFDGNATIEFNTWLFDEDFPGAFISVVK